MLEPASRNETAATVGKSGGGNWKSNGSESKEYNPKSCKSRAEPPKPLSEAKAAWLPIARLRRAQLQKIASARRDDPAFPWRTWARVVTNETMAIPRGAHVVDGQRQTWAAANAATALAYGRQAPYSALSEVPMRVLADVEGGAAEALAVGAAVLMDGASLGRAVGLTHELRDELKVWLIWPAGATADDLAARRLVRAERSANRETEKERDRMRKDKTRRSAGKMTRAEYLARAALIREACATAEISRDTFDRRPPSERERLLDAVRKVRAESAPVPSAESATAFAESVSGETINIDAGVSEQLSANLAADAGAPLKARHADEPADIADIYETDEALFDDLPPIGEAPEPIPMTSAEAFAGPASYDERLPVMLGDAPDSIIVPAAAEAPKPSPAISAHPFAMANEYRDREDMPAPRGAQPRPPLPPHPDMPVAVPGRNLLEALGVELGALVIQRAHEAVPRMLAARDGRCSAADNCLRMASVWEVEWRSLRREMVSRGATFAQCTVAQHGLAAITSRETRDASRYSSPIPRPPQTGAGLAA